jgi:hypothetical protein
MKTREKEITEWLTNLFLKCDKSFREIFGDVPNGEKKTLALTILQLALLRHDRDDTPITSLENWQLQTIENEVDDILEGKLPQFRKD